MNHIACKLLPFPLGFWTPISKHISLRLPSKCSCKTLTCLSSWLAWILFKDMKHVLFIPMNYLVTVFTSLANCFLCVPQISQIVSFFYIISLTGLLLHFSAFQIWPIPNSNLNLGFLFRAHGACWHQILPISVWEKHIQHSYFSDETCRG